MTYATTTLIKAIKDYATTLSDVIEEKDKIIEELTEENKNLKKFAEEVKEKLEENKWAQYPDECPKMNGTFEVTYKTEDFNGNQVIAVTDAYWTGMRWEKNFEDLEGVIAFAQQRKPFRYCSL